MQSSFPPIALLTITGFLVVAGFAAYGVKTGRVIVWGKVHEKKKDPTIYWLSMCVYTLVCAAFMYQTIALLFPNLALHQQP